MPSYVDKKEMRPNSYYHVYTHAVGNEKCFRDRSDELMFTELLRERLVPGLAAGRGRMIRTFEQDVALLADALMGNHLHFVMHQGTDARAISDLMHSLLSTYARAFNLRHDRVGPLFMKPFHVRNCKTAADVMNEIAYVHNNPRKPALIAARTSHPAYTGEQHQDFVDVTRGMRLFGTPAGYERFFSNYVDLSSTRTDARRRIRI